MTASDQYIANHPDGSQTLVTLYDDGAGELATRPNPFSAWGVPTPLEVVS